MAERDALQAKLNGALEKVLRMQAALRLIAILPADDCPGDCMEDAYSHLRDIAQKALAEESR